MHREKMETLINFFDRNAWDQQLSTYFSEVDNQGKIVSDKIFTVASSRLIYGLSYASQFSPEHLDRAKNVADFQIEKLIQKENEYYSHSYITNDSIESQSKLDVWQQAYGLCGLSELYRQTKDPHLLHTLHKLHQGFITRFHDQKAGGLWGEYSFNTNGVSGSKSLQSLMYPLTAYMINLWMADQENKELYENHISENLGLIYQIGWNDSTNWVNVQFNDDWSIKRKNDGFLNFTVTPGHNFQLAALLLRSKDFTFLPDTTKEKYKKLGKKIIDITLQKDIFHHNNIQYGFYSEVNPNTSLILDDRKTWWQHAEAIIALSLYEGKYEKEQQLLEEYFFNTFKDKKYGGEYFYVTKEDQPITSELKGSIGKSTYHTIELIRILNENK
ncbi:AGE family epimerase/isomerase [Flammeovirga agarivorans]|uniref:N-acylglucosamine 2-epimerase n=1 Tax=Flammeovirga agarivorans TaxID=2726742 RepID=A0A7X8SIU8_9BACT|nr:AGE family epimerase/isomerase [Flammeovirga agarivorans]NLR90922.1 hypothetical protein [Flammeovirga agarivorans]